MSLPFTLGHELEFAVVGRIGQPNRQQQLRRATPDCVGCRFRAVASFVKDLQLLAGVHGKAG